MFVGVLDRDLMIDGLLFGFLIRIFLLLWFLFVLFRHPRFLVAFGSFGLSGGGIPGPGS